MTFLKMIKPTEAQIAQWLARPYSWSQHSSFKYDKSQWYLRYILGQDTEESPQLKFGKKFADAVEWGNPMAPLTIYEFTEHCVQSTLDGLDLVGHLDSYDKKNLLAEYKTGVKKWDQKRVDQHGQFTFYALLLWLRDKKKPEDIEMILQWVPTAFRADFTYGFTDPAQVHTFTTSRSMADVLRLAGEIKKCRKEMHEYALSRMSPPSRI